MSGDYIEYDKAKAVQKLALLRFKFDVRVGVARLVAQIPASEITDYAGHLVAAGFFDDETGVYQVLEGDEFSVVISGIEDLTLASKKGIPDMGVVVGGNGFLEDSERCQRYINAKESNVDVETPSATEEYEYLESYHPI